MGKKTDLMRVSKEFHQLVEHKRIEYLKKGMSPKKVSARYITKKFAEQLKNDNIKVLEL